MDNKLTRNPETGYYEGTIRIQVDPDIFKRILLKEIEDDESADLTDPQTWNKITEKISKVSFWIDRPHTRVTEPLKVIEAPRVKEPTKRTVIAERIRELARKTSPHKWDELRTPIAPVSLTVKERDRVSSIRNQEKEVLKKLREEYEKGNFTLSEEAEKEEQAWKQSQNNKLSTQIGTLENLVNGSKIH